VLAIARGGEFNEQELRRAAGPSPLILFHQAERLLDRQLVKLCSYLASGANRPAGVFLGVPGLVPRLEKLQPSLFEDGRAICFNFYQLGRDEIDVFMRRQLRQSVPPDAFAKHAGVAPLPAAACRQVALRAIPPSKRRRFPLH
jgi:hypothetical protein